MVPGTVPLKNLQLLVFIAINTDLFATGFNVRLPLPHDRWHGDGGLGEVLGSTWKHSTYISYIICIYIYTGWGPLQIDFS